MTRQTAVDHGALGYVARASGVDIHARRDHPFAAYRELDFKVPVYESGDVYARAMMRVAEAAQSVSLIRQQATRSWTIGRTAGEVTGVSTCVWDGGGLAGNHQPLGHG